MKLREVTPAVVRKAVAIYLDLAYGGGTGPRKVPTLNLDRDLGPGEQGSEQALGVFQKDVVEELPGHSCVRYTMRLGNRNYPFMKLVLLEHLVPGEFYFSVDTHDQMDIKPDFPDYEAWMAVRRFNGQLKRRIEDQFAAEGLPTAATIRAIAAARIGASREDEHLILVVDDETDLCECVGSLLRARGYRMLKAGSGAEGLKLALEFRPDLMILDYEMPEMDGLEVIAALRKHPLTHGIPVLLTTASRICLDDIRKADGFLSKPFQEELLYKVVAKLLGAPKEAH